MKNFILCISLLFFLQVGWASNKTTEAKSTQPLKGTVRVFTTPDLYPLTIHWADEFGRLHPGVHMTVIRAQESTITRNVNGSRDLAFVPDYTVLKEADLWKTELGREVIVPVLNASNPLLKVIEQEGIPAESLALLFEKGKAKTWATILKNGKQLPVHYYRTGDASVNTRVARFLGLTSDAPGSIPVKNTAAFLAAIQQDPYALGFCKLTDVIDYSNQSLVKGIRFLPIDRNNNGKLDYFEDFYGNLNSLSRAVWLGKYPRTLTSRIYTVASVQPTGTAETAFLKWVFTDGQQYLAASGYSDLTLSERQSKLDQFGPDVLATMHPVYSSNTVVLFFVIGMVVLAFGLFGMLRYGRRKKAAVADETPATAVFKLTAIQFPKGLFFGKSHTWAFMEKDGTVKVGIDDFLQHTTGLLTRLILKNPGDPVKKGEPLVTLVQNGKQLNVMAPVSGTILRTNQHLLKHPSLINSAPYTDGWVYTVEPANWVTETRFLNMAAEYREWIAGEYARLKDFLNLWIQVKTREDVQYAFNDGGELKDNVLESLGPELWETFQRNFIDNSELR
ncbi:MAG: substrate-binding domain-containing protein [Bacteroidales bacterium]|nr:substrate-binding domain-containing protein [Bacteroidales bacterium]